MYIMTSCPNGSGSTLRPCGESRCGFKSHRCHSNKNINLKNGVYFMVQCPNGLGSGLNNRGESQYEFESHLYH